MIERVIADSFNITQREKIDNKNIIVDLDFNNNCDLAYLRMKFKRELKSKQGQGKTLQLIASDDGMTKIDIDYLLDSEGWQEEIIYILNGFNNDMKGFNLFFKEIKIV